MVVRVEWGFLGGFGVECLWLLDVDVVVLVGKLNFYVDFGDVGWLSIVCVLSVFLGVYVVYDVGFIV